MKTLQRLGQACLCIAFSLGIAHGQQASVKDQVQRALQAGNNSEAVRIANDGVRRWPSDPDLLHLRGLAYFRLNDLVSAEQDLRAAQKLQPSNANIAFDYGLLGMAQQKYEQAAEQLEKALKVPSFSGEALPHVMLGRAYQNSNRSELAIEQFKAALRIDPSFKLGHYHLGYAYASVGRNEEAVTEYRQELRATKDSPELHYQYGRVLVETGNYAEAQVQLLAALALQPNHADAQYELGKCLLLMGRTADAIKVLQQAVKSAPSSPSAYFQLARALHKAGDMAGSRVAEQKFMELKKLQQQLGGMASGRPR